MTGTDLYVNKPHCAAAVRLIYIQISPGHIWTTLYFYTRDINALELRPHAVYICIAKESFNSFSGVKIAHLTW